MIRGASVPSPSLIGLARRGSMKTTWMNELEASMPARVSPDMAYAVELPEQEFSSATSLAARASGAAAVTS